MLHSQLIKSDLSEGRLTSPASLPELERSLSAFRAASPAEKKYAISTLVLAFSNDPAVRWLFPDPHQYLTYFPQFAIAFAGAAFDQGTAYVSGDYAGTALWFSPGVESDSEAVGELLQGCLFEADQPDAFAVFDQMAHYHPHYPHWYLALLGIDPRYQSQGHGSGLLGVVLDQCDRDCLPAYLESSNPENVPFYQHHGFEVMGTIQAGRSPRIFPMLRQPIAAI